MESEILLTITAYIVVFVSIVVLGHLYRQNKQEKRQYTDQAPSKEPWKTYAKWTRERGTPIVTLRPYGTNAVVLNDLRCASALLEKNSANYLSRPDRPLLRLMGRADNVGVQPYGPRLKKCRKLIHDTFHSRDADKQSHLECLIEEESISLLRELLKNTQEPLEPQVSRFVASMIYKLAYGHCPDSEHFKLLETTTRYTNESLIPGKWLVDSYPFLQYLPAWMPGGGFKKWAHSARSQFRLLTEIPFQRVKDEIVKGTAPPSFVRDHLIATGNDSSMEPIIAGTAASFHSAGTDTLAATILSFILTMVVHPQIQRKAYEEIICVVGADRLPTASDCKSFPYLTAVMKEVHRFNPAVPMSVRFAERKDDYYGQCIRSGSWVFVNMWAMTHDESVYTDPHVFSPERFLPTKGPKPRDSRDIIFGFDKRRCPGSALANNSLMVVFARLLSVFDLQPSRDLHGVPIIPAMEFSTGFTSPPKPFTCTFVQRSSSLANQIIDKD
ncbi:cytochrome P450 [Agrocybe pediades]|nr:cytochrome P450 [Agrocybe pediades]